MGAMSPTSPIRGAAGVRALSTSSSSSAPGTSVHLHKISFMHTSSHRKALGFTHICVLTGPGLTALTVASYS